MDSKFAANLVRLETHCKKQLGNPNKVTVEEHTFTLELINEYRNLSVKAGDLYSALQKNQTELQSLRTELQKLQTELAVYKKTSAPAPVKEPEPAPKPKEEEPGW